MSFMQQLLLKYPFVLANYQTDTQQPAIKHMH